MRARSFAACGKRAAAVAGLALAAAVLPGCAPTRDYHLGQRIDMGPYSFEVVSADEGRWGSEPTINIFFRLTRDDAAPFTSDFESLFAYKMELIDAAGNAFPVDPDPVSPVYRAGGQHAGSYRAQVRLSPSHEGVRDAARIGTTRADFRLIIDNPAPEGDQPRRVAIQLH